VGGDALLIAKHPAFGDAGSELQPGVSMRGSSSAKVDILQGTLIRWKKQ